MSSPTSISRGPPAAVGLLIRTTPTGCLVRLDGAVACASVSVESSSPSELRPSEGFFVVRVRSARDQGTLERMLQSSLKESFVLDAQGLCVVSGSFCLRVVLRVDALSFVESKTLDACSMAAWISLRNLKRNNIHVDDKLPKILAFADDVGISLPLGHVPICITHPDTRVLVAINELSEICALEKMDDAPNSRDGVFAAIEACRVEAKERFKIINQHIIKV